MPLRWDPLLGVAVQCVCSEGWGKPKPTSRVTQGGRRREIELTGVASGETRVMRKAQTGASTTLSDHPSPWSPWRPWDGLPPAWREGGKLTGQALTPAVRLQGQALSLR